MKVESKSDLLISSDNVFDISTYRSCRSINRIAKASSKDSNRAATGINKN